MSPRPALTPDISSDETPRWVPNRPPPFLRTHVTKADKRSEPNREPVRTIPASQLRNRYRAPHRTRPEGTTLGPSHGTAEKGEKRLPPHERFMLRPRRKTEPVFFEVRTSQMQSVPKRMPSTTTRREVSEWRAGFARLPGQEEEKRWVRVVTPAHSQWQEGRDADFEEVNELVESLHLPQWTSMSAGYAEESDKHGDKGPGRIEARLQASKQPVSTFSSDTQSYLGDEERAASEYGDVENLKEQVRLMREELVYKTELLRKIFEIDQQRGTNTGDSALAWLELEKEEQEV